MKDNTPKITPIEESAKAWMDHVAKIGPGSPCECGREHVCEGCSTLTQLTVIGSEAKLRGESSS